MKSLNDFISEDKKKKSKPHAVKEGEGRDDKKYILMMEEYKRLRRTDKDSANKLLERAQKLARRGDVSQNAKVAGAYI